MTGIKRMIGKKNRRLIFHIGDQKTGSSTIQNAFAAGKVHVEGKALLYPAAVAHNYLRQHFRAVARGKPLPPGERGMPGFPELDQLLKRDKSDFVVFSGEGLAEINQKVFQEVVTKRFRPGFSEFQLIAYVRPHASRVLASFTEQSKIGAMHGSMEEFHARSLNNKRFVYLPRFQGWRDRFGDEFILRPMVKSELRDGSVLTDFLHTALGDQRFCVDPIPDANVSVCLEDLVLIRLLQARLRMLDKPLRTRVGWDIAQMLEALPPREMHTRIALHKSLAEQIYRDYIDDARAMDAAFFADAPIMVRELEKSVDTAIPEPQPLAPEAHFSADELRHFDVLIEMIAAMIAADEPQKWQQFFRRRHEQAVEALRDS